MPLIQLFSNFKLKTYSDELIFWPSNDNRKYLNYLFIILNSTVDNYYRLFNHNNNIISLNELLKTYTLEKKRKKKFVLIYKKNISKKPYKGKNQNSIFN